jgi:Dockerin type I domain
MKQFFFGRKSLARSRRDARTLLSQRRTRRSVVERLEDRNLLTGMPFGALPDDTAEYMLGDVYVNVVLMESDSNLAPFDESTEDWTPSEISNVKSRIAAGLQWWEDTLDQIPNVRDGLLNFTVDWTHADSPVHTGYEPITRTSQEFANWVYDFLGTVGFTQTGNFLTDLRAYNNAQRLAHNANWAFTIFVADDSYDLANDFNDTPDDGNPNNDYDGTGRFAPGSQFSRSFAYAGGNAFVMPADRPASIVAHETGHIFWAYDEYNIGSTTAWQLTRGYYNTQNTNSTSNPTLGTQADSIMSSGAKLDAAYAAHTSSTPSLEMIGWKDSDSDGIFDVLDVRFSLTGNGQYDSETATFNFVGKSQVRTLANQNTSGLKDDITINQIDRAEYSIDGGSWTTAGTYHKYTVDLNLEIPIPPGASELRIRTVDDRTGAMSDEFVANFTDTQPQSSPQPGLSGYVFSDRDGGGTWESFELGLPGWLVQLVNQFGQPVNLRRQVEPEDYIQGALLNFVAAPTVKLSAVGGDVADGNVYARNSAAVPSGGKVFANNSIADAQPVDTWTGARQLKIEFAPGVSALNIKAISSGSPSVGRLEIYNSGGVLLGRYTTGVLANGQSELMKLVRPQADIAYAIASGHAGTKVVLDSLDWGATSSTVTGAFGYYNLPELPAGLYRIAVVPKPNYSQSFPSTVTHLIHLTDAMLGASRLNFGYIPLLGAWRNPGNALDVNNDGFVTAIDALSGINYINNFDATQPLPPERPDGEKYLDVNNDGYVSPADILMVINELNRPATPPQGGEGFSAGGSSGGESIGGGGLGGSAGGESDPLAQPLVPGEDLAAQYYSRNPLQLLEIPGSDDCHCEQCTAITEVASGRVGATLTDSAAPFLFLPREMQAFALAKKEAGRLKGSLETSPHLDISLLDVLAQATSAGESTIVRRGKR